MKQIGIKILVAMLVGLFPSAVFPEGFVAGTLVKTTTGYQSIESLRVGDKVMCYNANKKLVARPIMYVAKERVPHYMRISVEGQRLGISSNQQLYKAKENTWAATARLKTHDSLLAKHSKSCSIDLIECVNEPTDVYLLGIEEFHNFCVSLADVCAHNFAPAVIVGISWVFGLGTIELSSIGVGLASLGAYIGYKFGKASKNNQANFSVGSVAISGSMMPEDPNDRDSKRKTYQSFTNKEAEKKADSFGFKKTKSHPCGNTSNKPVFTDGKRYISPDADGHNGGMWKVFDRKGVLLYSMDADLEIVVKTY